MGIFDFLVDEKWRDVLSAELAKDYIIELNDFLNYEIKNFQIFPPPNSIFSAFNLTSFEKVKVVILGQDPYHGKGQAHGLCFSVPDGVKRPPSLKNIFKELQSDIGMDIPANGNLEEWAKQGVLLLNTTLTVRESKPLSHNQKGWEHFTDTVISILSREKEGLIFLLWGKHAQTKEALIDDKKHFILKAAHPSPLSAYNGFFGCCHFSKTNILLKNQSLPEINWKLSDSNLKLSF